MRVQKFKKKTMFNIGMEQKYETDPSSRYGTGGGTGVVPDLVPDLII